MSYEMTCTLSWAQPDVERVRAAIETAIAECAIERPEYANARIEVSADTIHVYYPRALVQKRGSELVRPATAGAAAGYHCSYDHYYFEPMPQHGLPASCSVSITSKRNDNAQAWVTATNVLVRVARLLGGDIRDT